MPGSIDAGTYYEFDLTARPWCGANKNVAAIVPTGGGDTIRFSVWFPYVLNSEIAYSLALSGVSPAFSPIRGTLHKNVLTFLLPLFGVAANETAHGTIYAT